MLEVLKQKKDAVKKEYLRKKLIEYYKKANKNKVAVPAFILANEDIKLIEKNGTLDFWYKNFREKNGLGR